MDSAQLAAFASELRKIAMGVPPPLPARALRAAGTPPPLHTGRARLAHLAAAGERRLAPAAHASEQAAIAGLHGRLNAPVSTPAPRYTPAQSDAARHATQTPHDMLQELPAVRAGVSPAAAYNLMGQDPAAAQRALMSMWDSTTPVHAAARGAIKLSYLRALGHHLGIRSSRTAAGTSPSVSVVSKPPPN
jgi:hypothetical protein